jgi:hypothetical protein
LLTWLPGVPVVEDDPRMYATATDWLLLEAIPLRTL